MINKLRNKIALINLVMASIILLSALIAVAMMGYRRVMDANDVLMDGALNTAVTSPKDYPSRPEFDGVAVLKFEKNKNVEVFINPTDPRDLQRLKSIAQHIVESRHGDGIYFFEYTRFSVREVDDDTVYVALLDIFTKNNSIGRYFVMAGITLVIALGCFFVISYILADLSIKPLEDSWLQQKQFVADASHELKTPLSVIMANVDIIASHPDEPVSSQMKWIENTRTESQKMAELVNSLLFLAKHDDALVVQKEDVNFSDCAGNMSLSYDAKFYEND